MIFLYKEKLRQARGRLRNIPMYVSAERRVKTLQLSRLPVAET